MLGTLPDVKAADFEGVAQLIALIYDADGCAKRMAALQAAMAEYRTLVETAAVARERAAAAIQEQGAQDSRLAEYRQQLAGVKAALDVREDRLSEDERRNRDGTVALDARAKELQDRADALAAQGIAQDRAAQARMDAITRDESDRATALNNREAKIAAREKRAAEVAADLDARIEAMRAAISVRAAA